MPSYEKAILNPCTKFHFGVCNIDQSYFENFLLQNKSNAISYINGKEQSMTFVDYRRAIIATDFSISILIPSANKYSIVIDMLCQNISIETGRKASANLYFTKGALPIFKKHYDGHDIIVQQLYGSKRWQLFDFFEPVNGLGAVINTDTDTVPRKDIQLSAGDFLYLPKGTVHLVQALDFPSIHLSFAFRNNIL